MMVKPTVKELLEHAENRFALVIATSRRARQIANGDKTLTEVDAESPVTLAANEINEGKVEIYKVFALSHKSFKIPKIRDVRN